MPFLSVIIPAHNEEDRLPNALRQVCLFLKEQKYTAEVLVVENGSTDHTIEVAYEFKKSFSELRILQESLAGKGRAVRQGILAARGEYRFIADADFSMPVEQINRFLPPISLSDIAIASREVSGAVRHGEPILRHLTGRVFNYLIRLFVLPGLQDTQCGFKCFRADVAKQIFPLQTLTGWAFDVEVLAIAKRRGYKITEIGIPWYYNPGSKISILQHSWRMFFDLLRIRKNILHGVYDIQE